MDPDKLTEVEAIQLTREHIEFKTELAILKQSMQTYNQILTSVHSRLRELEIKVGNNL